MRVSARIAEATHGASEVSVERFAGKPQLIHYMPGHWGRHLIEAAKVAVAWTCNS